MDPALAGWDTPPGTNLKVYIGKDSFMAELETMSPFVALKPHHMLKHTETWVLRDVKGEPRTKAIKRLFCRVGAGLFNELRASLPKDALRVRSDQGPTLQGRKAGD